MSVRHDIDAERELWDAYAASALKGDAEASFCWTQYAGHGPGVELLGEPRSVLEIGCGTGRALAYLARRGVAARGVDLSPVMVKATTAKWAGSGAEFVCSEVLEYLGEHEDTYDAVYSIFGAAWFTDPGRLFPLVRRRLTPGGVFVFSQPPAIPGAYGPQGMYKGGFAGKAMYTYRYSYRPAVWERLLTRAGFATACARILDAPHPGHIGTLLVHAVAP
ncbi:class I SAM-dependent methyltransferase [Actinacidiphila guanduensis]|uniref:Ubiquinone/menaquinone biosynthesis C-methylase UbiE n=1 Tax=Actinacidiphila guanduensis TaxID=310781 RepID=A0A1G9XV91_9ACTN|nr:class I SAM-dependent methyltransferase [Actinacidiphila guanduensis]SDN00684.1 Ubiquinone/menaquinone biosynthesis C-methylase UbiE [Actinacidiphila guanduensis]